MEDFVDQFIKAHALGTQVKRQKEQFAADQEERQWRRDITKAELKRQELQDKLAERIGQRNEAAQSAQLMQGQEGSYTSLPDKGADPGNAAFGLPGGAPPVSAGAGMTIPPVTIPGAYSPNTSVTVQPKTGSQLIQEDIAKRAREAQMKRSEEHDIPIPEGTKSIWSPSLNTMIPVPTAAAKEKQVTNEVELFQKDPVQWEKMIRTKAAIDHVLNPQAETDAKFQWRMFKSDPEAWKQVYGAGKKEDAGERLIKEYNLAEKTNPGADPDVISAAAQRIHKIVDAARAGATDPYEGLAPPAAPTAPAAPGIMDRVLSAVGMGKKVKVKNPQGKIGTIPAENLPSALKAGYEQVP